MYAVAEIYKRKPVFGVYLNLEGKDTKGVTVDDKKEQALTLSV